MCPGSPGKPWKLVEVREVREVREVLAVRTEVVLGLAVGEVGGRMGTVDFEPLLSSDERTYRQDGARAYPVHTTYRSSRGLVGMGTWGTGEHAIDRYCNCTSWQKWMAE